MDFGQNHAALRQQIKQQGLDFFIIPHNDAFQSEYIPPSEERLWWASGFSGSAGYGVVGAEHSALFVDGRYEEQARHQALELLEKQPYGKVLDWLFEKISARGGQKTTVGYDSRLTLPQSLGEYRKRFESLGDSVIFTAVDNPIDKLWRAGRPPHPRTAIYAFEDAFSGESFLTKVENLQKSLKARGLGGMFVSDPPSLAWLLNMRASDVDHVPVALVYGFLPTEGPAVLFADQSRVDPLWGEPWRKAITIEDPAALVKVFGTQKGRRILFDKDSLSCFMQSLAQDAGVEVVLEDNPVLPLKAIRNEVQQKNLRAAHRYDGIAMVRFLCWLDGLSEADLQTQTEETLAAKIDSLRLEHPACRDLGFRTISGVGPNSALPHYNYKIAGGAPVTPAQSYLVDSGGQYFEGTTDMTRTVWLGNSPPSQELKTHFTLVLAGHMDLATAVFPAGVTGGHLDAFARRPLWMQGLDYNHGTGHGVGAFLSVHEGPQGISSRSTHVALEAGMVLSNEPGLYFVGRYGIRIENLMLVRQDGAFADSRPRLLFEALTLCPIDRRLIDPSLLTNVQRAATDAYHKTVYETLSPLLKEEVSWLKAACRPL